MALQYISDNKGRHTAVVIPIAEWENITAKHQDLQELMEDKNPMVNNASNFKGLLTDEEADQYRQHLKKARNEWERDI